MENKTLLKANLKKHKGTLAGIWFLTFLVAAALGTVLSVWSNSESYIGQEMRRASFGDITAWVSDVPNTEMLTASIESLSDIQRIETQDLIFSHYTVNGQESDSEGQLIAFVPEEGRYRFFTDNLSGYKRDTPIIRAGEVYVSPSLSSMFGVKIGDEITFPIARNGNDLTLAVKGFYEDPFMGSSMIGMKGFLISEEDRVAIQASLQNAGIDALARVGAMLHIFSSVDADYTISELNSMINENTELSEYTEFVHSFDSIKGFMLILQNAFSGLLIAFVAVLTAIVLIVLSHSIGNTIEADTVNMGILKTVGFTGRKLRLVQLLQYMFSITTGLFIGFAAAVPISRFISSVTVTTTGILIPSKLPAGLAVLSFLMILLIFALFIVLRTVKISRITPMQAIRRESTPVKINAAHSVSVFGKGLYFRLALRQLVTGKKKYIGACIVAVLLVFFASLVGRMGSWLGSDGKGMMDAFNPADHDIGVQVFGELTAEQAENTVLSYSDITDTYLLAMPSVSVNGIDYTANVISEPERFHILEGRTSSNDNEIVLTEFVAADLGVTVGDTVTVRGDSGNDEYIISGIYSCANDMGDNIGMSREGYLKIGKDDPHLWCYHYFLSEPSQKAIITKALENTYGGDIHIHENTWPGLFGIISAMQALIVFMYIMVILFILIVTVMTGSKILASEQRSLGIYKAIGFKTNKLRLSFALRFSMAAVIGSVIGTVLAAVFTDSLVSSVMKLAGISNFVSVPTWGNVLLPSLIVIFLFTVFAYFAAGRMKKIDLTELISE
jgi:putative ABC transport system permease protein